jgi:tRNA threonylcarbamoyladenosine biosynthesis protein TsaB
MAAHRTLLVLDTASTRVQAGRLGAGLTPAWAAGTEAANAALFQCVDRVLGGRRIEEIEAFAFCEGPGSMLGIRTAAVALRTWTALRAGTVPVYAYGSLDLVARDLACRGEPGPFQVIADARRDSWHCVEVRAGGAVQPLVRVPAGALAGRSGPLFSPAGFRTWAQPPRATQACAYDVAVLLAALVDQDCFHAVTAPDALLHEEPVYQTWTSGIHRAPSPAG